MGEAHQLTTIGGIALARAVRSKICSFHFVEPIKSTHEFKWYTNTLWPNGPHKHLIWYILISHEMCLFGKCGFPICPSHMVD